MQTQPTPQSYASKRFIDVGKTKAKATVVGRTALYVDCNSLWHGSFSFARRSASQFVQPRVDYFRLQEMTLGVEESDGEIMRAYILSNPNVSVDAFKEALLDMGYTVKVADKAKTRTSRTEMLADILADADKYDTAIIATQDSFFAPTLAELKSRGKRIVIAAFPNIPDEFRKLEFTTIQLDQNVLQASRRSANV